VAKDLDITQPDTFGGIFTAVDAVVHAAALVGDWGPLEAYQKIDREGTANVLQAAERAQVTRFVHVSSITVYGFRHEGAITEDAPVVDESYWPYMQAKADAERVVEQARRQGYPVTIVRPGNVYGPRSDPWTVRPAKLVNNRLISLPKGFGPSNTVYVENVCALIAKCIVDERAKGETFHVVDEAVMGFDAFFGEYAKALGRGAVPIRPRWLLNLLAAGLETGARLTGRDPLITRCALDFLCFPGHYSNEKSKRVLGFVPSVSAEEGMARTIAYLTGPDSPL
jgi:nucleoside-diphosphate-sugar epimerase